MLVAQVSELTEFEKKSLELQERAIQERRSDAYQIMNGESCYKARIAEDKVVAHGSIAGAWLSAYLLTVYESYFLISLLYVSFLAFGFAMVGCRESLHNSGNHAIILNEYVNQKCGGKGQVDDAQSRLDESQAHLEKVDKSKMVSWWIGLLSLACAVAAKFFS